MATYLVSESSTQDGALRELYTFVLAGTTYRLTSHDRDVTYDGQTYTSTAGLSRGNTQVVSATQVRELVITLPVDHPAALALIPIPPRASTLTIERVHEGATTASTDRRIVWIGTIAGLQMDGDDDQYARIRVPHSVDLAFDVTLPGLHASRLCQHQLYSTGCTVARLGALVKTPTVVAVSGRDIECSTLGAWTYEAKHGEVVRVSDGERRSIVAQAGAIITVDVPFATLEVGDALEVARGCDKTTATCRGDFINIKNFSGYPLLPTRNPASPTGGGIQ